MDEAGLRKIDELTLDINFDLCILNNALKYDSGDLEISILSYFVEQIYAKSNEIRKIF